MTAIDPDAALRALGIVVTMDCTIDLAEIPEYVACLRCGRLTPRDGDMSLCAWCESYYEMWDRTARLDGDSHSRAE